MTDKPNFKGYTWGESQDRFGPQGISLNHSVDWGALCRYASKLHGNEACTMDPQFTMGLSSLIRIINFASGTRWVAKIRIPTSNQDRNDASEFILQEEVNIMQLVRERTRVPVPQVFGYIADPNNEIGVSFMLIECLPGNAAIDLHNRTPMSPEQKKSFHDELAGIQAEFSSITFPKIGRLTRLENDTWDVSPLGRLGGPFDTASEYLEAWADTMTPAAGLERLIELYGEENGKELDASMVAFPNRLKKLAATIPTRNSGPFPLIHVDFGFGNVVVNDDYKILGLIDWESAHVQPWERVRFPLCVSPSPAPMGPSEWYDASGGPVDEHLKKGLEEEKSYVDAVRRYEEARGLSPTLSNVLGDRAGQDLAYALHSYDEGMHGWYSRILDIHHKRWSGGNIESEAA